MGHSYLLRSPKKEEQEVPDSIVPKLCETDHVYADKKNDTMDELEGILGIDDEENLSSEGNCMYGHLNWDLLDWEGFTVGEEEEEEGDQKVTNINIPFQEESHYYYYSSIKRENYGFWDDIDDQKRVSLNLSLNYQEVLDAWSGRGSLWADGYSLSMANNSYMGEVPVMEEERTRREASVLRYKEKRQSRLFSKKIRYQVRKLNADKRPRLKGRFVKKVPEKILK